MPGIQRDAFKHTFKKNLLSFVWITGHSNTLTLDGRVCVDVGHSSLLQHLCVVLSGWGKEWSSFVKARVYCSGVGTYLSPLSRPQESKFFCVPAGKHYGPPRPPAFHTHKHTHTVCESSSGPCSGPPAVEISLFLWGQRAAKVISHHCLHPFNHKASPWLSILPALLTFSWTTAAPDMGSMPPNTQASRCPPRMTYLSVQTHNVSYYFTCKAFTGPPQSCEGNL